MLKKLSLVTPVIIVSIGMTACSGTRTANVTTNSNTANVVTPIQKDVADANITPVVYEKRSPRARRATQRRPSINRSSHYGSFAKKLSNAALGRLQSRVRYDGAYIKIGYPWGDVPANIGVCTDVVIRSYRKLGIDLQSQVHQDMVGAFSAYPNVKKWGLSQPDTNIDHRRVYNLRAFFQRRGAALPITRNPADYRPGDLVTWMVGPGLPHIGVVVDKPSRADPRRKMIVHNIANGPEIEDILFRFPISGHYRYTAAHANRAPKTIYASRPAPRKSRGFNRTQLANAVTLLANAPVQHQQRASQTLGRVDNANAISQTTSRPIQLLDAVNLSPSAPVSEVNVSRDVKLATLNKNAIRELLAK
ncbi:MAG: DUF1287 domain-containing protein [Cocleimonas sp.]|nr:DUF1287 domain-containing protein [Cocleimonas sp.]